MVKSFAGFILALSASLLGQSVNSSTDPEFTLYATSRLVVLNVGVQDGHGANIRGLKAQDFKVYEDGHLQTVKQFVAEDRPVTIGIVVDASGSMRTKQAEVVTAGSSFVHSSNPDDEMFVINFNDKALPGLPSPMRFSNDPRQLGTALLAQRPAGKTAFYDALVLAADYLAQGKWENKALLLISDGGDNTSTHTLNQAIRAVKLSGATVYVVGLFEPEDHEHDLGTLHRLAKLTGGEAFTPEELSEIEPLCRRIAADIRASYTLAYTPPRPDQQSLPRKVKVVATAPAGGKLNVRARTSYTLADR